MGKKKKPPGYPQIEHCFLRYVQEGFEVLTLYTQWPWVSSQND